MSEDLVVKKVSADETPIDVKPRDREAWPKADVKVIARAVRLMASYGIASALKCRKCKTDVLYEANGDGYDLVCDCKRRVIHRGV